MVKFIKTYMEITLNKEDAITCRQFLFFFKLYILLQSYDNFSNWFSELEQNKYYEPISNDTYYHVILGQIKLIHIKGKRYNFCTFWGAKKFPYLRWKKWYIRFFFNMLEVYRIFRIWSLWRRYNIIAICGVIYFWICIGLIFVIIYLH